MLIGGMLAAFAGMPVDEFQASAASFLETARHPTLGRPFTALGYRPMVELVRHAEANGFTTFIASGGRRDLMRTMTLDMCGLPPERIVGSSDALEYQEKDGQGELVFMERPDSFDDGPVKPVRIRSRVGQRPILAAGNSDGDLPMLSFAHRRTRPSHAFLVRHDDAEREFAYDRGSEEALDRAPSDNWTIASMARDWATVFG